MNWKKFGRILYKIMRDISYLFSGGTTWLIRIGVLYGRWKERSPRQKEKRMNQSLYKTQHVKILD